MIYLVSNQQKLWESNLYKTISVEEAIKILEPLTECECDTETKGLDPYTKELLTIQLGNKNNQIVFDVTTGIHSLLKEYLESDRLFLFWNAQFDLLFLYHNNIYPNKIYDGMLVEQLLYLGYDKGYISYSLKEAAYRYNIADIDKSVRGVIINEGLTERVIVYAAGDVMYLSEIKTLQLEKVKKENLQKAVDLENEFVKCLAYIKYCGVHLDIKKWTSKMESDKSKLNEAENKLNDWVIDYFESHGGRIKDMTIESEIVIDSQFEHNPDKLIKLGYKIGKFNDKFKSFTKPSNNDKVGLLYCQLVRIKFPYLKMDLQGDLWSGFKNKPDCIINWSSPKQLIPFFEMLGFNLDTFDKKTKDKKKTVSAKHIIKQSHISSIAKIYAEYKDAAKVCESFGENWLKAINPISGRLHVEFHQLGTATARISSGGGTYKLNLQQLPNDAITRACFTAESGNSWISVDYDSQESRLLASVANDPSMLDLYTTGCGDMHSLVAKMSFSDIIPEEVKVEDIKKLYHNERQQAKTIEFAINYGGDFNTISQNNGIPLAEAKKLYNNYMEGFPGVKKYQDYCRKAVIRDGYILMNPVTGHRSYIQDWKELEEVRDASNKPNFWEYIEFLKSSDKTNSDLIAVKNYLKRKSDLEKNSINYRIQNRGACAFKLAGIMFFNWIKKNNLINKVKICVPAHDEFNIECPKELSNQVSSIICKAMEKGGAPFCTRLPLTATPEIGDHWIH